MDKLLYKLGWSQAYFARRIGVTEQTINRWNKTEPPRIVMLYLELCARLIGD